jgi:hypothetical protein
MLSHFCNQKKKKKVTKNVIKIFILVQIQENQPKKFTSVVWVLKLASYPRAVLIFNYKATQNLP